MTNPFSKLLTLGNDKRLKGYQRKVQAIGDLEEGFKAKSNAELKSTTALLQERVANGEALAKVLPEAFALVREASLRTLGMRHFDVQLIGAMALNDGCIAEMKTGEGKTLVATAAAFLNALTGENVHVVTVNDYLAKRDSEWMGKLYNFLGLEVGLIQNGMDPFQRVPSYKAHITYGTNSEFGFDYLRDNMVGLASERVQRGQHFAIVDEVDSILIDEARTPLIISGLGGAAADLYNAFAEVMPRLSREEDIVLDEAKRTVYASEKGLDKIEEMLGMEIYADTSGKLANHLKQALRAEFLFRRDVEYVVIDGELKIVDEFTGRIMEGRRFSEGLHQALEAKEHVEIQDENQTLATVTLQNYFRLYEKLSGMTGTALTEDSEFRQIYKLPVVPIPTNKPVIRQDKEDLIFRTVDAKYKAVADEVERRHAKGQPVLIGTSTIEASERLSRLLDKRGVPHETLNAKNPEREARIVEQAGRLGAVTIATNMAGRGTDILLGGNRDALVRDALARYEGNNALTEEEKHEVAEAEAEYISSREGHAVRVYGGLCVIGTDRHESRRIDNQLRGRAGRQGDPGESQFYLSLEDNLLKRFGQDRLHAVSDMMIKRGMPDDQPLQDPLVSKVIGSAQRQVESIHFGARKNVLEYDDVMNLQRKAIYEERNAVLDGKEFDDMQIFRMLYDLIVYKLQTFCPYDKSYVDWDYPALDAWMVEMSGAPEYDSKFYDIHFQDILADLLHDDIMNPYRRKRKEVGTEEMKKIARQVMLRQIDTHWIAHLQEMDYLKNGIGLRALGHRDPLVEYKEEAYRAFTDLTFGIYEDFIRTLVRLPVEKPEIVLPPEEDNPFRLDKLIYSNVEAALTESGSSLLDQAKNNAPLL